MARPGDVIGSVLVFDIVVIGGYLPLTEPLDAVDWIVPWVVPCNLLIAGDVYKRLSEGVVETRGV